MKKNFEIPFAESKKLSMKELKQINGGDGDDDNLTCGDVENCGFDVCYVNVCWDKCEIDTSEGLM